MDRNFGGVIWTNHALARLSERGIKQGDAWATFNRPQESRHGSAQGTWVYYRTYGSERIEVVAKKNERGEWIILSVWSRAADGNIKGSKVEPLSKILMKKLFVSIKKLFKK